MRRRQLATNVSGEAGSDEAGHSQVGRARVECAVRMWGNSGELNLEIRDRRGGPRAGARSTGRLIA